MLSLMNQIQVKKGETYLVKGGVPHAIGAGCLLIEVQEPTDYTIRVEKVTPAGFVIDDQMCHQGLGFEKMFDCFRYQGMSEKEVKDTYRLLPRKVSENETQLITYQDTPCFCMEELETEGQLKLTGEGEFYCLYVLEGKGTLESPSQTWEIAAGAQFFVPAACGEYCIRAAQGETVRVLKMHGPK